MLTNLLKRIRRNPLQRSEFEDPGMIYKTLICGLDKINRSFADRAVLDISECEPDKDASGRWLNESDFNYYPFETLTGEEKQMVLERKNYRVISLVKDNVNGGNLICYPMDGKIEVYERTHVIPLLPKLKPESNLNYVSKCGVVPEENFRDYAETLSRNGVTSQYLEERIERGIQDYHNVTCELMESSGVNASIKRLNEREYTPFDKIMEQMRSDIRRAIQNDK